MPLNLSVLNLCIDNHYLYLQAGAILLLNYGLRMRLVEYTEEGVDLYLNFAQNEDYFFVLGKVQSLRKHFKCVCLLL